MCVYTIADDHSRVVLKPMAQGKTKHMDYINGNFVDVSHRFLSTWYHDSKNVSLD